MKKIRTFAAIEVPGRVRKKLRPPRNEIQSLGKQAKLVAEENVHLTIKFLGDVVESDIYEVCEACRAVAAAGDELPLAVRDLGVFPRISKPRVVWAGVEEPAAPGLANLHQALEKAFGAFGIAPEGRPFHPHLTLARFRHSPDVETLARILDRYQGRDFGEWIAEDLVLFMSALDRTGPTYTRLGTFPLGERD